MLTATRNMARTPILLLMAGVLLAGSICAEAANLGFLKHTPISYMKERDMQLLNKAARTALDTKDDGQSLDWSNHGAGNPVPIKGTITPTSTKKSGDRTCRTVTIVAEAKGQTQSWTPVACKRGGEDWQLEKQ